MDGWMEVMMTSKWAAERLHADKKNVPLKLN